MTHLDALGVRDFLMDHSYVIVTPLDGKGQIELRCGCGYHARDYAEVAVQTAWAEHVTYEASKEAYVFRPYNYVPVERTPGPDA